MAGNPAKILCTVEDYYERNKQYDLHTKGVKDKESLLLNLSEDRFLKK